MQKRDLNNSRYVCFYNLTRQSSVATHARVADGHLSRLVGLLGTTRAWPQPGKGLWLVPSGSVHTLGMLYALDVVFLNRDHVVVEVQENLRPFRVSKLVFKAHSVLELPVGTVARSRTRVGDTLEITPAT